MIYILDRDFNVKFVNESTAEKFHCKPSELIGKPCWELMGRIKTDTGREHLKKTVSSGEPIQSLTEVVFPSGKRTLMTVLIPFKDDHEVVSDLVGVSYDITEQWEKDQIVRNKMGVILGYAEMLSEIIEDDEILRLIGKIREASVEIKDKLDSGPKP